MAQETKIGREILPISGRTDPAQSGASCQGHESPPIHPLEPPEGRGNWDAPRQWRCCGGRADREDRPVPFDVEPKYQDKIRACPILC